ncbi:hypothetical protein KY284_001544 [Solanum tuberosum]|nr:hypothetical protein KY284_001544 [Solanum tuberosum]
MSMMGELTFFLGLKIKQTSQGISICQEKYIKELLKKFNLLEAKVLDTPISTRVKLDRDENGMEVNQAIHREIIGSLLYLTVSRPAIVFCVGICARFQATPNESHLKAAKCIMRYLKGTQDLVLFYLTDDSLDLISFADVDYAGFLVDRKSTSGMAHFLGSSLIS